MTLVSDGCIAHVSLKLNTADVRASHEEKYFHCLERFNAGDNQALIEAETEDTKITKAREKILEDVKLALKILLNIEQLPEMIDENSKLELRLLLCRVKEN